MDQLFLIQLITSFIVGGVFIALLSFLAEKSSDKVAGIIITLPSTIAISFFFIGWTLSPEKVATIAPLTPIAMGIVLIFTIIYLYLSKLKVKKVFSVILCLSISLLVWFVFAMPLAIIEFSNLIISIIIYLILGVVSYYFLTYKPHQQPLKIPLAYSLKQKIIRAVIAGFIIMLAVFLSKTLGPFWGGIFSVFPAVFTSTLPIIHWNYDSQFLFKVWKNSPIGSITTVVYGIAVIYTFPAFGFVVGTILAYVICLLFFILLIKRTVIFR